MRVGVVRVGAGAGEREAQIRELKEAEVDLIWEFDAATESRTDHGVAEVLDELDAGDTVVVPRLSALTRSLKDFLSLIQRFDAQGVGLECRREALDTTTAAGRMFARMLASLDHFDRARYRARARAGQQRARAAGRAPGRPRKLDAEQERAIYEAVVSGACTASEAARRHGVHPSTVSRLLERMRHCER